MTILSVQLKKTGQHYIQFLIAVFIVVVTIGLSIFIPFDQTLDLILYFVIISRYHVLTILIGTISFIIDIMQGLYLGTGLLHLIIILGLISLSKKWRYHQSFSFNWLVFSIVFVTLKLVDLFFLNVTLSVSCLNQLLLILLSYPYMYQIFLKLNKFWISRF